MISNSFRTAGCEPQDQHKAAKHAEIAQRYNQKRRFSGGRREINLRLAHTKKLLWFRHYPQVYSKKLRWPELPDDDAGRDYLWLICDTIFAQGLPNPTARFRAVASDAAPWIPADELDHIIGSKRLAYSAVLFGQKLRLTDAERTALRLDSIWPFDVPRSQMLPRRKQKAAERERNRRAGRTAKPRKVITKTDRAKAFLCDVLPFGLALSQRTIMSLAVRAGIQKDGDTDPGKPLRAAREALGIKPRKNGLTGGWIWEMPPSQSAESAHSIEDALTACAPDEKPSIYRRCPNRVRTGPVGTTVNTTTAAATERQQGVVRCEPVGGPSCNTNAGANGGQELELPPGTESRGEAPGLIRIMHRGRERVVIADRVSERVRRKAVLQ